ncbi:Asparagine N-glycosylation enzyme, membrane subunit Stt3 [Candidatus Methanophagaceae archaeon]|nr:Asparagine N-glycosylation enzyme, membrane subunit Stt3 [Methanophagales archaeon]
MSARKKIEERITIILLFILAFTIRFMGGAWETKWDNDAYMARQAEYIYSFGHPAVPDPFSSAPLYQPGMAYLLAFVGWLIDLIPYKFAQPSMIIAEGLVPPLLGAATVLVIYWFATTLFNKSAGIIAGVLASFSHILILRTMKGFVFHNALSLFLILLTVVVFWHALKTIENQFPREFKNRASYLASILAPAVLIGITGFTWGGYFIIHAILLFYGLLLTAFFLVNRAAMKRYASYLPKTWVFICSTLFIGTIIALILYQVRGPVEIMRAAQMLGFSEGPLVYKFTGDLMQPGLGSFESLFGTFLLVGIALTAVGAYGVYKRDSRSGLYLIAALLATMIPAVRAEHFLDMFSMFVYISVGIGAAFILEAIARQERQKTVWKKLASVAVIMIIVIAFVNPVIGSVNEVRYLGGYIIQPEKKAAFLYLQNNTAADSLFINWWDHGNSLAYYAKRRPVIDQMYFPDEAVKAVSAVIVATDPDKGLQIARTLKQKHNSSEVYLMLFWYDAFLTAIMGYFSGYDLSPGNESIRMTFDDNGRLVGQNELTNRTNYYRLWTNQSIEGYTPFYVSKEVKIFRLDV